MKWLVFVTLILVALTGLYAAAMRSCRADLGLRVPWTPTWEPFADYIGTVPARALENPDVAAPQVAEFAAVGGQGLLADVIPLDVGLSGRTAAEIAGIDRARQMELGGQYVQRTNNYRREYPDNWTAPLSEFVGAIYRPKDGVGEGVPCPGAC